MSYFNYVINAFRKYESEYQSPIIHLVDRSFTVHTEKVVFKREHVVLAHASRDGFFHTFALRLCKKVRFFSFGTFALRFV